jgi:hypothetical protein
MKHYSALILVCLISAACSSTSAGNQKASHEKAKEGDPGVICTKQAPIGSLVEKKTCTTPADREAAARRADDVLRVPTGNTPTK